MRCARSKFPRSIGCPACPWNKFRIPRYPRSKVTSLPISARMIHTLYSGWKYVISDESASLRARFFSPDPGWLAPADPPSVRLSRFFLPSLQSQSSYEVWFDHQSLSSRTGLLLFNERAYRGKGSTENRARRLHWFIADNIFSSRKQCVANSG